MQEAKPIREPKQKRSMEKKQQVLDTAKALFCARGYHAVTTNEIAKEAGLSIGTLYSYFADKETILLALLHEYNRCFEAAFVRIAEEEDASRFAADPQAWFMRLTENLIELHRPHAAFHRQLQQLYYTLPAVAAVMDGQTERVRQSVLGIMQSYKRELTRYILPDLEAQSILAVDFIGALVDRIVFHGSDVEDARLLKAGTEALCKAFL